MSKMDDVLTFLLAAAAVIGGAALLDKLLNPDVPCPTCGRPVKQFVPVCPFCKTRIQWITGLQEKSGVQKPIGSIFPPHPTLPGQILPPGSRFPYKR